MTAVTLTSIVSLILALSVASERLVEIVKGLVPILNKPIENEGQEAVRCAALQILAVLSGVATAYLAKDYIPKEVSDVAKDWSVWGLGLLASGGSAFWNSILTYLLKVKDIKSAQADAAKARLSSPTSYEHRPTAAMPLMGA